MLENAHVRCHARAPIVDLGDPAEYISKTIDVGNGEVEGLRCWTRSSVGTLATISSKGGGSLDMEIRRTGAIYTLVYD
jgi:hypothetical protein